MSSIAIPYVRGTFHFGGTNTSSSRRMSSMLISSFLSMTTATLVNRNILRSFTFNTYRICPYSKVTADTSVAVTSPTGIGTLRSLRRWHFKCFCKDNTSLQVKMPSRDELVGDALADTEGGSDVGSVCPGVFERDAEEEIDGEIEIEEEIDDETEIDGEIDGVTEIDGEIDEEAEIEEDKDGEAEVLEEIELDSDTAMVPSGEIGIFDNTELDGDTELETPDVTLALADSEGSASSDELNVVRKAVGDILGGMELSKRVDCVTEGEALNDGVVIDETETLELIDVVADSLGSVPTVDETDAVAVAVCVELNDGVCRIDADTSGVMDGNREGVGEGELSVEVEGVELGVAVVVPVAVCDGVVTADAVVVAVAVTVPEELAEGEGLGS